MTSIIFRHPLHRLRVESGQDRYGNQVPGDWATATPTPVGLWAIDAGDTTENEAAARTGEVVEYTARKIGTADLIETDRIVYAGRTYTIDGAIQYQPGPTARTSHTIIRLRRAVG